MKKIVMMLAMIGFFFLIFPISIVSAGACPLCPTTFNPFTGKLDYYGGDNTSTLISRSLNTTQICISGTCLTNFSGGNGTVTTITFEAPGLLGGVITNSGTGALNYTYLNLIYFNASSQLWNYTGTINEVNNTLFTRFNSDNTTQALQIRFLNDTTLIINSTIFLRINADNTTQAALINAGFSNDSTIFTRESSNNATQAALISALTTAESSNNATQAALINHLFNANTTTNTAWLNSNTTQAAQIATVVNDNVTQAALINAGFTNDSTIFTREASDNTSQNLLLTAGFTNDSTIFTRESSDNSTQASQIALVNTTELSDNLTQANQIRTLNDTVLVINSTINTRIAADNSTQANQIALINTTELADNTTQAALINLRVIAGSCAAGTVVQNTTTAGVQCVTTGGSGTVTSVNFDAPWLLGGAITSTGNGSLNITALDLRYGIIYYYVAQIANNTGTINGTASNANTVDGLYINVTETASGLNVTFNFTGVNTSFNGVDFRQKYTADVASQMILTIYNTLTANFDTIETLGAENNYINARIPIFNSTPYINATTNLPILRIVTISTVLSTDVLSIDVLTLNKQGLGSDQTSSIVGGGTTGYLSLWNDATSLGDSILNQTVGNLFARNNLTAINFYGNINWSYLQNIPTYVKDWSSDLGLLSSNISNQNSTLTIAIRLLNDTMLNSNATQAAQIATVVNDNITQETSIRLLNNTMLNSNATQAAQIATVVNDNITQAGLINNKGNLSSPLGSSGYLQQYQSSTQLNNSVIFQNASKVGINTTTPTFMLQVSGDANITNLTLSSLSAASCDVKADAQGALICGTDANSGASIPISNRSFQEAYYPNLIFGGVGGITPSALDTSARCSGFEVAGNMQTVFNNITVWVRTANTSVDFKFAIYNCTSPGKFQCTNGTLMINSTWKNMATTGLMGVENGTTNWVLGGGYYAACIATNNTNAMNNAFQGIVNTAGQNGVYTSGVINGTFPTTVTLTPSAQNMPAIFLINMYGVAK